MVATRGALYSRAMSLSSAQRRSLAAAGNRLKAGIHVSADAPDDGLLSHLRTAFERGELLKVRVNAADREQVVRVAAALAAAVPCELVQRVGRVVLLYRPRAAQDADR